MSQPRPNSSTSQHKIVRNIHRPDPEHVKILGDLGVATVHEAQGRTGLMKPYMRPIFPTAKCAGPAVTVLCSPCDNIMIHAAIEVVKPGDVLVVTCTSDTTDGYFGELIATSLVAHGVKGLIIETGVRDVADLTAMNFPVWSRAIHSQGTVKDTPGSVNIPIVCAGAFIKPGDIIVADIDGVCVVPRLNAAAVAKASQDRVAKEEKSRARLKAGELSLDFNNLRAKLQELGVVWVDSDPAND
jgi:4-hydroxy-4-methyl-2-oxoglutarate aldolase